MDGMRISDLRCGPRYLRYLEKQIDKAYDRAHFLNERKILMQEWADYLDEISNSRATV